MKLLQRLIDKIRQSLRKFLGLPAVDVETLPDLKDDLDLKEIFDHMPNPMFKIEQIPTQSPFGDLSYEDGLKHDEIITRSTTANHIVGAYTTGTTIDPTLLMKAVYVLLEGLDITVHDAAKYKLLVDEARKAFKNQDKKLLEAVFDRQDKFRFKLADKIEYRQHAPKHHHKRKK